MRDGTHGYPLDPSFRDRPDRIEPDAAGHLELDLAPEVPFVPETPEAPEAPEVPEPADPVAAPMPPSSI